MLRSKDLTVLLVAALATWCALALPFGIDAGQGLVLGIVLVTLALWGTGVVPGYVAATFLFASLILTGSAEPERVFASFSSSAIWLVIGGAVIGAAIATSGLGARLGRAASPHLSKSYPALIGGLMLLGVALAFLMPSSLGRAAVLVPVGMALADTLGLERGSTGRTGVAVIIALGSNMPGFAILPSNIPNLILAGMAQGTLGTHIGYGHYLLLHFPVLGVLKSLVIVLLVLRLFPASLAPAPVQGTREPLTLRQIVLMVLLGVTLVLWSTDRLHGINPAWIGLGTALILMIPQFGFVGPAKFREATDFATLLFVAGALALGTVVNDSGLGTRLSAALFAALPLSEGQDLLNFAALTVLAAVTSLFTTIAGAPAVLTPLAPQLAQSTGFSLEAVLMSQVMGFSSALFPYQITPLIVAMGLAGESTRALVRVTFALCAITLVALMPLQFLWWKVLGVL